MFHEDISRRWYNFDDSEEIILDDRLDDLSVNTQGIVYTEGIPDDDEVEVQVDATRRTISIDCRTRCERRVKEFCSKYKQGP